MIGAKSGAASKGETTLGMPTFQSQINLEGKINYALFLLLRALPHAEEDFPIEICKYFSACFVCANGQEIGENVAAGRAIAGIKAGN